MRLFAICLLALGLVGCATNRTITIDTMPSGARISVGPKDIGLSPVVQQFTWESDVDVQVVRAEKKGYQLKSAMLYRDHTVNGKMDQDHLVITLDQNKRSLTVTVDPPSMIYLDDQPRTSDNVGEITIPDLNFTVDAKDNWTTHKITAQRTGYKPSDPVYASYTDPTPIYNITLQPLTKPLNVSTNPPDAQIFFDEEKTPLKPKEERPFPYDPNNNNWLAHKLTAHKEGFPDKQIPISWDDGQTDYTVDLTPRTESIRIKTTPPGAIVKLDGKELSRNPVGDSFVNDLPFPPVDEKGTLKTYAAEISMPKTGDTAWYPKTDTIKWDPKKSLYEETLEEIRTVPLPLLTFQMVKSPPPAASGWDHVAKTIDTVAAKDTNEPSGLAVQRLTPEVAKGQSIDSIALSPDGKRLIFTILVEKPQLHSMLYSITTDGKGVAQLINDGKSLDVTPSFSPDGMQILFASDRAGNRLSVWGIAADGARMASVYTSGFTNDLWPTMDSGAKANVYCESYTDRQDQPRIYKAQIGTVMQSDLGVEGSHQPRINPTNDTVLFNSYNEKTGKRDIFRVNADGGVTQNITNTPDIDEYDAVWDRGGAKIAYVCDFGVDQDKRHNADIWALDLTAPNSVPKQITFNASQDDCPVWDPSGRAIYFRSNRGGEWGIWKITLK